jgi:hypothetical protein
MIPKAVDAELALCKHLHAVIVAAGENDLEDLRDLFDQIGG